MRRRESSIANHAWGEAENGSGAGETADVDVLGAELHDRVIAELTALILEMEQFKREQYNRTGVQSAVAAFQSSTREALAQLRDVVHGLQSGSVDLDHGLVAALRTGPLTELRSQQIRSTVRTSAGWPRMLDTFTAVNLFRIIEQALRNVIEHSGAGRVTISLRAVRDQLQVEIADDGAGFPWAHLTPGQGAAGMERRALVLGGTLECSQGADGGAVVRVTVPRRGR